LKQPLVALVAGIALLSTLAIAQSPAVDNVTRAQMIDQGNDLKQKASSNNGAASVKLKEYPNHYTMIAYRSKTGAAEVHEHYADFFFILKGSATLTTGGKLVDQSTVSPGELHGTSVEGGVTTPLHEGDCVHIPAGTPHQLVIESGIDFLYYVIKAKEN
jgi:mannose-6-phosphate isomerase-like protein (cupin superfamily)